MAEAKSSKKVEDGYTVLVGPGGQQTTVPDEILEVLLEAGYSKK